MKISFDHRMYEIHLTFMQLLTKWSRNMTDERSTQIMNVLLTPSSNSNLPLKTPIFLFIKYATSFEPVATQVTLVTRASKKP